MKRMRRTSEDRRVCTDPEGPGALSVKGAIGHHTRRLMETCRPIGQDKEFGFYPVGSQRKDLSRVVA